MSELYCANADGRICEAETPDAQSRRRCASPGARCGWRIIRAYLVRNVCYFAIYFAHEHAIRSLPEFRNV